MHHILFEIGPFTVYSYGFMIAVGFLAALGLCLYRAPKLSLIQDEVWNLWFVCLIGGLLGAKLLYVIVEFKSILASTITFSDIATGFVVYGGIIGGALSIWGYCRFKKMDVLKYLDLIAPAVAAAQGFGRIGCFLAGCCYGRETDSAIGVLFANSPFAPNHTHVLPTQLFSAAGDFILAVLLLYLANKIRTSGVLVCLYFTLYGIGRFIIEFFRNDYRGEVGIFSTSQFISIFIVIIGIAGIFFLSRKAKTQTV